MAGDDGRPAMARISVAVATGSLAYLLVRLFTRGAPTRAKLTESENILTVLRRLNDGPFRFHRTSSSGTRCGGEGGSTDSNSGSDDWERTESQLTESSTHEVLPFEVSGVQPDARGATRSSPSSMGGVHRRSCGHQRCRRARGPRMSTRPSVADVTPGSSIVMHTVPTSETLGTFKCCYRMGAHRDEHDLDTDCDDNDRADDDGSDKRGDGGLGEARHGGSVVDVIQRSSSWLVLRDPTNDHTDRGDGGGEWCSCCLDPAQLAADAAMAAHLECSNTLTSSIGLADQWRVLSVLARVYVTPFAHVSQRCVSWASAQGERASQVLTTVRTLPRHLPRLWSFIPKRTKPSPSPAIGSGAAAQGGASGEGFGASPAPLHSPTNLNRLVDVELRRLAPAPGHVPTVAVLRVPLGHDCIADAEDLWAALQLDCSAKEDGLIDVVIIEELKAMPSTLAGAAGAAPPSSSPPAASGGSRDDDRPNCTPPPEGAGGAAQQGATEASRRRSSLKLTFELYPARDFYSYWYRSQLLQVKDEALRSSVVSVYGGDSGDETEITTDTLLTGEAVCVSPLSPPHRNPSGQTPVYITPTAFGTYSTFPSPRPVTVMLSPIHSRGGLGGAGAHHPRHRQGPVLDKAMTIHITRFPGPEAAVTGAPTFSPLQLGQSTQSQPLGQQNPGPSSSSLCISPITENILAQPAEADGAECKWQRCRYKTSSGGAGPHAPPLLVEPELHIRYRVTLLRQGARTRAVMAALEDILRRTHEVCEEVTMKRLLTETHGRRGGGGRAVGGFADCAATYSMEMGSPFLSSVVSPAATMRRVMTESTLPSIPQRLCVPAWAMAAFVRRESMRETLMKEMKEAAFRVCSIPLPDMRVYRVLPPAVPRYAAAHARGFNLSHSCAEEIVSQQRALQRILIAKESQRWRREQRRLRKEGDKGAGLLRSSSKCAGSIVGRLREAFSLGRRGDEGSETELMDSDDASTELDEGKEEGEASTVMSIVASSSGSELDVTVSSMTMRPLYNSLATPLQPPVEQPQLQQQQHEQRNSESSPSPHVPELPVSTPPSAHGVTESMTVSSSQSLQPQLCGVSNGQGGGGAAMIAVPSSHLPLPRAQGRAEGSRAISFSNGAMIAIPPLSPPPPPPPPPPTSSSSPGTTITSAKKPAWTETNTSRNFNVSVNATTGSGITPTTSMSSPTPANLTNTPSTMSTGNSHHSPLNGSLSSSGGGGFCRQPSARSEVPPRPQSPGIVGLSASGDARQRCYPTLPSRYLRPREGNVAAAMVSGNGSMEGAFSSLTSLPPAPSSSMYGTFDAYFGHTMLVPCGARGGGRKAAHESQRDRVSSTALRHRRRYHHGPRGAAPSTSSVEAIGHMHHHTTDKQRHCQVRTAPSMSVRSGAMLPYTYSRDSVSSMLGTNPYPPYRSYNGDAMECHDDDNDGRDDLESEGAGNISNAAPGRAGGRAHHHDSNDDDFYRFNTHLMRLLGAGGGLMSSGITFYYTYGDATAGLFNASIRPMVESDPWEVDYAFGEANHEDSDVDAAGGDGAEESGGSSSRSHSNHLARSGASGDGTPATGLEASGVQARRTTATTGPAGAANVDGSSSYLFYSREEASPTEKAEKQRVAARQARNRTFYSLFRHVHDVFFKSITRTAPPRRSGPHKHRDNISLDPDGTVVGRSHRVPTPLSVSDLTGGDRSDDDNAAAGAGGGAELPDNGLPNVPGMESEVTLGEHSRHRAGLQVDNGHFGISPLEVWLVTRYSRRFAGEVYLMDVAAAKGDPFYPAVRVVDEVVAHAVLFYHNRSLRDFLDDLASEFGLHYEPRTRWGRYCLGLPTEGPLHADERHNGGSANTIHGSHSPHSSSAPHSAGGCGAAHDVVSTPPPSRGSAAAAPEVESHEATTGGGGEGTHQCSTNYPLPMPPTARQTRPYEAPVSTPRADGHRPQSSCASSGHSSQFAAPLVQLARHDTSSQFGLPSDTEGKLHVYNNDTEGGGRQTASGNNTTSAAFRSAAQNASSGPGYHLPTSDVQCSSSSGTQQTTSDDDEHERAEYPYYADQQEDESIFYGGITQVLDTALAREMQEERMLLRELDHLKEFLLEHRNVLSSAMLTTAGSNKLEAVFGAPATVFPFLMCARESVALVHTMFHTLQLHYGIQVYEHFSEFTRDVFERDKPEIIRHSPRIFRTINKSRRGYVSYEELCSWMARKLSCGKNIGPDTHVIATAMSLRLPMILLIDKKYLWPGLECTLTSLSDFEGE